MKLRVFAALLGLIVLGLLIAWAFTLTPRERLPQVLSDAAVQAVLGLLFAAIISAVLSQLLGGAFTFYRRRRMQEWTRDIPDWAALGEGNHQKILQELDAIRTAVCDFVKAKVQGIDLTAIRANVMLPSQKYFQKVETPGQLEFVLVSPEGSYSDAERGNRFAPGEGVSGTVFLTGAPAAEPSRHGVDQTKLDRMEPQLQAVVGYPLAKANSDPFGVVCVDFVSSIQIPDGCILGLRNLGPAIQRTAEIARLISSARKTFTFRIATA